MHYNFRRPVGHTMPESLTDRNTCHTCQKHRKKKLSKCKSCHAITYCGLECQAVDWPRHSDNCVPVMVTQIPGIWIPV